MFLHQRNFIFTPSLLVFVCRVSAFAREVGARASVDLLLSFGSLKGSQENMPLQVRSQKFLYFQ